MKSVELNKLKKDLINLFKSDNFTISTYEVGASIRRYYLLEFEGKSFFSDPQVLLMQIPVEKIEIVKDYLNIYHYFKNKNIPCPNLYKVNHKRGWIFTSLAVGEQLNKYIQNNKSNLHSIYNKLIDFLINFQNRAKYESTCIAFNRFFDFDKYQYEFQFHVKEQLFNHFFSHQFSNTEMKLFQNFSTEISRFLDSRVPIFVHRDFQSSNIFYDKNRPQNPFQLIDFQDARSGSLLYDLVSLLCDSYINIPKEIKKKLSSIYYENQKIIRKYYSLEQYEKHLDYTIIQRKLHDAGAFVFTYRLLGKKHFIRYIEGAIKMVIDIMRKYNHFNEMKNLLFQLHEKNFD